MSTPRPAPLSTPVPVAIPTSSPVPTDSVRVTVPARSPVPTAATTHRLLTAMISEQAADPFYNQDANQNNGKPGDVSQMSPDDHRAHEPQPAP